MMGQVLSAFLGVFSFAILFHAPRRSYLACAVCGAVLFISPRIRQGLKVCDDCAGEIPRLFCGRRTTHTCFGCGDTYPRRKLKMKNRQYYCKKCLKIKFDIDF